MGSEGEDVAAKLDAAVRMFMQQFTETKTLRKGSKRSKPISKQSDAAADALNIRVDTVSHAIDNLERCDDLIVSGILFVDGEDLSAMFKAMLRHIGLGESAPSSVDIRRLYPRSPSENNSSFIKNQFALRNARDDFYYAYLWKHDLKLCHLGIDSTRRVYVNESLTDAARKYTEKAYDSVWQEAILHKIYLANFPLYILKIVRSFLQNRSCQVVVNGHVGPARSFLRRPAWCRP
ncbi:hypothetical protein quinque_008765 [Culex quinquefasciatus]